MYEMRTKVTYSQVKSDLKTDMGMIVRYFQDCALFHSESIQKGLDEVQKKGKAWFLSSWQIEVVRYPKFKEEITVRTWPHDFKGLYGCRNFDILDAQGIQIVRANSIWIFMDLKRRCPVKPGAEDLAGYDSDPAIDMEYAPRKIQIFEGGFQITNQSGMTPITVKKSFLDSNLHVNNGRYVEEALDLVPDKPIRIMRVDYRKAAVLGDVMYPAMFEQGDCCQVVFSDKNGIPFVIIEIM